MRRPGARWWSANGKTVGWKSDTVAADYVTRKSRCSRWFRRPRQPSRGRSDGCRHHRKAVIPGERAINNSGQTGGQRNEKKSCGNGGAVESVEIRRQDFPSSHRPWKSRKEREIPTFPQLRRLGYGKVENQKQVSHFPTAIYSQVEQKRPTASAKKRGHFYRGKNGDISNEA